MKNKLAKFPYFLVISLILTVSGDAIAQIALPETPQIAQNLRGQCRAVNRSTFLYSNRSETNPIESIAVSGRVTLEEEDKNNGWIAVRSLTTNQTGFVRTQDLTSCTNPPTASTPPSSRPPKPVSPQTLRPNSGLCRRVIYDEGEGVAIRANPNLNAERVGGVMFGEMVRINPSQTRLDATGREWVKLNSPVVGWMSNGFPNAGSNLGVCI